MEKLRLWEGELLPRSQSCLNTADGPVFVLLREAPLSLPTLCSSSWGKFQPPSPLNSGVILKYFWFTTESLVNENSRVVWSNRTSHAALVVKNLPASRRHKRHGFNPWVRKIPWRRAQQPTPVFLPGESPWTEEPGGLHGVAKSLTRLSD